MRPMTLATGAALVAMLMTGAVEARPFGGRGGGGHGFGGPGKRCARALLHGHPDRIKAELKLSDAQWARLEPLRDNFMQKRIRYRAEMQQVGLKLRKQMQVDLPNEGQVLRLMRQQRSIRGKLAEEGAKTHLRALAVLNPEQRKALRERCFAKGWAKGPWGQGPRWDKRGRGRRGPRGGGPGWGGGQGWGAGGADFEAARRPRWTTD